MIRISFLIQRWKPSDDQYSLYSEADLRKLHKAFGRPSLSSLHNLLKRTNPDKLDTATRKNLEEITAECKICQKYRTKPGWFNLTVCTEDLQFNHCVAADVMYLVGKTVIHAVDEATHFCAARFVKRKTSEEIWKTIMKCWNKVYLGPPDFLRID